MRTAHRWRNEEGGGLSFGDIFQETTARYKAVEPSSGSNVIPRRARPGLASLRPYRGGGVRNGETIPGP